MGDGFDAGDAVEAGTGLFFGGFALLFFGKAAEEAQKSLDRDSKKKKTKSSGPQIFDPLFGTPTQPKSKKKKKKSQESAIPDFDDIFKF